MDADDAAPAHADKAHADADASYENGTDEYADLALSITSMMRDEIASRERLTRRVTELEQALNAAKKEMDDLRKRNAQLTTRLQQQQQQQTSNSAPPAAR